MMRQLHGRQSVLILEQDITASCHELLADGHVAKHGSRMQSRLPVGQQAQIRAILEQHCDHRGVSLVGGLEQRRGTVTAHRIDVRPVLQQHLAYVIVPHLGRYPQWGGSVDALDVRRGVGQDQQRQNCSMPILCSYKGGRGTVLNKRENKQFIKIVSNASPIQTVAPSCWHSHPRHSPTAL